MRQLGRLWCVVALTALALCLLGSVPAGARVVRLPRGRMVGVMLASGSSSRTARAAFNGGAGYGGGPVLHAVRPYLIFWDPAGEITTAQRALFERYLTDVAHDSGKATNVYAVLRQYYDSTGYADYAQSFSAASDVISDTQPYPTTGNCAKTAPSYPTCLSDANLQAEISREIAAGHLPTGVAGVAPVYLIVTALDVNVCLGSTASDCAGGGNVCAWHGALTPPGALQTAYAVIPMLPAADGRKGCQGDGTSMPQEPNGSSVDVVLDDLSHELSESITDPLMNAWTFSSGATPFSGEVGDQCANTGVNANAFLPTLGGSATAGTLYNQLINGDRYYTQSEWSDGGSACLMQPPAATAVPAFSAALTDPTPGRAIAFDPTASQVPAGLSSWTWSWGDGSTTFSSHSLAHVFHRYLSPGRYQVTLTLVDQTGALARVQHVVLVHNPLTAKIAVGPGPLMGSPVAFAGSGAEAGGTISGYLWSFGDGSRSATGARPRHTYKKPGRYTVTLAVTDGVGATATARTTVVVDELPSARISATVRGRSVSLSGLPSHDPDGRIFGFMWSFGDGRSGPGSTVHHTYPRAGRYRVTLTVLDSSGHAASARVTVRVR